MTFTKVIEHFYTLSFEKHQRILNYYSYKYISSKTI